MNIYKNKSGETLLEVIMAVFIVATGSAAATGLIVSSLQANSFSRDSLVAMNLAVEGIEAVRNIRDTNWLKYSFDKEHCWNVLPGQDCYDDSDKLNVQGLIRGDAQTGTNYTVDLDPVSFNWSMNPVTNNAAIDVTNTSDPYVLNTIYLKSTNNGDPQPLYVSENARSGLSCISPLSCSPNASKFHRMIQIKYLADSNTGSNTPTNQNSQTMLVTSIVEWENASSVHNVTLNTILTNYQKFKVSQ